MSGCPVLPVESLERCITTIIKFWKVTQDLAPTSTVLAGWANLLNGYNVDQIKISRTVCLWKPLLVRNMLSRKFDSRGLLLHLHKNDTSGSWTDLFTIHKQSSKRYVSVCIYVVVKRRNYFGQLIFAANGMYNSCPLQQQLVIWICNSYNRECKRCIWRSGRHTL